MTILDTGRITFIIGKEPYISNTRTIRCHNAGDNVKLQLVLIDNSIAVTFKFTAPGSPQFNGVVERKFQTLFA